MSSSSGFTREAQSPERIPGLEPQWEPRKETKRWGYATADGYLIVHAPDVSAAASKLAGYLADTAPVTVLFADILPLSASIDEKVTAEGEMSAR